MARLKINFEQPFCGYDPLMYPFGFRFKKLNLPKKYIINENACILFWDEDGEEKTIVKRTPKDEFNKRLAFLTAYFQKHSGLTKTQANKYLDNLVVQEKKK